MSILFEPIDINGMRLKNRFVRSATWEGMAAENGDCTPKLIETMARLAQGGVGLIVTGHAYVTPQGKAGQRQLGIYTDRQIEGLTQMAAAVHAAGGVIVAQLAHSGMFADPGLTGMAPAAPSEIDGLVKPAVAPLSEKGITDVTGAFGAAAERAKTAGFDGIQIHAAHGYLLSQFLSPFFNRRSDRYGGEVDNRARILVEVLTEIRGRVGGEYPVLIKMNTQDYLDGGLTTEDAVAAAALLQDAGIDAIELSGGTGLSGKLNPVRTGIRKPADEAYFREAAVAFRASVSVPLFLVGGIRSFETAERLVADNVADGISMSRPFIREPDLIRRWQSGDRRKSACLSDSRCFVPARSGEGIHCVMDEREKRSGGGSEGS